jgi:uncharacterized protein (TIGR02453 family)
LAAHFSPELFRFLRDLKKNNDRAWFTDNRARYEEHVKDPLLAFIAEFQAPLRKISPHFVADPRGNGGSMFRIHRDTRFSKDKTPYKTQASAQFRHEKAKDVHAPGFYLHLEPGQVFVGAGIWRPDTASAGKIREAIADDPVRWRKIQSAKAFRETLELAGESLKRPPRGIDKDHPLIEDLKRKDFIVVRTLTEKDATDPAFLGTFAGVCRTAAPFVGFVTEALGLKA